MAITLAQLPLRRKIGGFLWQIGGGGSQFAFVKNGKNFDEQAVYWFFLWIRILTKIGNYHGKPLLLSLTAALGVGISTAPYSHAETYLTMPQAQQALWQQQALRQVPVTLSKKQMKAIAKASKTLDRHS